jgi:hypothetical protein
MNGRRRNGEVSQGKRAPHRSDGDHRAITLTASIADPVVSRADADTLQRLLKGNRKFERLLNEKLGTDFFGTLSIEVIFSHGQVEQVNVHGLEKIR